VRRKFYDLQFAHQSPVAQEALERIGALYAIEDEIRGRPPNERREIRQARARPLLESLRAWLENCMTKLSKQSRNPCTLPARFPALRTSVHPLGRD
jgi:hypothetical protein